MEKLEEFAHECRIRDLYSQHFCELRSDEYVITTEHRCGTANVRADLLTVDKSNTLREWEFKIRAGYKALGQILTYVALTREEKGFERSVRGVIAAFEFQPEIRRAVEVLNLGIELIEIPAWMAKAGEIPITTQISEVVSIPKTLPKFNQ
jgi:RecB family endonuclease NucS